MESISLKAFAKINPSLDVLGKRPDGYHEVWYIMQLIELHDFICLEWEAETDAQAGAAVEIAEGLYCALTCDDSAIPTGEENLAMRAVAALYKALSKKQGKAGAAADTHGQSKKPIAIGMPRGTLSIHIEKHIPMAAGLAGGSADGAAALLGANHLWGAGLSLEELCQIGGTLGVDIPFALRGQAAKNPVLHMTEDPLSCTCCQATGTGTSLSALPPIEGHLVLSKPALSVSTKEAYEGVDEILGFEGTGETDRPKEKTPREGDRKIIRPDMKAVVAAVEREDLFSASEKAGNTLENHTVKRYHEVEDTIKKMREAAPGALVHMSGSGPTVFLLTRDKSVAETAAKISKGIGNTTILTKTLV